MASSHFNLKSVWFSLFMAKVIKVKISLSHHKTALVLEFTYAFVFLDACRCSCFPPLVVIVVEVVVLIEEGGVGLGVLSGVPSTERNGSEDVFFIHLVDSPVDQLRHFLVGGFYFDGLGIDHLFFCSIRGFGEVLGVFCKETALCVSGSVAGEDTPGFGFVFFLGGVLALSLLIRVPLLFDELGPFAQMHRVELFWVEHQLACFLGELEVGRLVGLH